MPAKSNITDLVTMRLPKDVLAKAKVNAAKQDRPLSQYLARIIITQLTRKR